VGDENEAMEHATWNGTNYSGVLSFCSYNSDVSVSDQATFFHFSIVFSIYKSFTKLRDVKLYS
jgi:hypothetical protein